MEKSRQFWSNTTALEVFLIYLSKSKKQVLEDIDLTDKTFLITGTTSGIGIETAKSLALKGAHVVMANRNLELSEQIRDEIYEEVKNKMTFMEVVGRNYGIIIGQGVGRPTPCRC